MPGGKILKSLLQLCARIHDERTIAGDGLTQWPAGNEQPEVAPLAFMRGRTLAHAFVILDEAQNTTPVQMKMFLTRLGEGSRMVVTGDPTQVDLPPGARSGLADALEALRGVDDLAIVRFTERDVVRHALVARIVGAYEARDRAARGDDPPG